MRYPIYFSALIISSSFLIASQTAHAQDQLEEIIVLSHPLAEQGLAQSLTVISGDELEEKVQSSLGETIAKEAGINSASFGSAVGRPIIRGLGGPRVKTTEDRIDTMDVSVTSGDHAVTIEPFIANQINILKGASTLLYGSGAIGGIVDVDTGRIAKQMPEQPIQGKVELRGADNANAKTAATRLDGAISDNVAWHIDVFSRDADDYDIPGFAESFAQMESEEHDDEHEDEHEDEHDDEHEDEHDDEHEDEHAHEEEEEIRDILEGSRSKSDGGSIGFSFIGDQGFVGVAVSTIDSEYGLVGGHGHGHEEEEHDDEHDDEHEEEEEHAHEEEEEGVGMLDMEQTRFDLEAQINNPFSGIESINFRMGINDYEHAEIEGNGEIGTLFTNEAWEGRVQLNHESIGGFDGSFGLQLNNREFSAIGEEAFVPPVETDSVGLFWVAQREFGQFDLELGARVEEVEHTSSVSSALDRDFSPFSTSLGVILPVSEAFSFTGLLDYSSRAPSIEELYSNGPHFATQSFEIGDPDLQEESALGLSVSATYITEGIQASATLYHTQFDDFIYEANTGEELDELPVYRYRQNDADFTGLDAKANIHLTSLANGDLDLTLLFDTVKAEIASSGANLPRIPASRLGAGLEYRSDDWDATINYLRVSDQDDVAAFELPTESYNDISIFVNRSISIQNYDLQLFIHGRNLGDDEQRNHASIVKDFAPAPGRRFEAGIRFKF